MRLYPYALPLVLLLPLPACGDDGGTSATDGSGTTGSTGTTTGTTDGSTGTTGSTADPTTGTTDTTTGTTTGTTDASTSTTDATTDEPSTGTTGGPLVGDPATYGQACAPDDGPATEFKIDLAERKCDSDWPEDVPFLRITLFQGVQLAVGEYPLDGGWGFAYYDDGNGVPVTGDTGSVTITEVTADGLRGTYDVTLSDATNLIGGFDALYCPVDVLCG